MKASKETEELFKSALRNFEYYVTELSLPAKVKDVLCTSIGQHSSYYLFYPHLFKEAFKTVNPEKLDLLCIAGFFYYRSILYLDKVVDSQVKKDDIARYFQVSQVCQEESIKILTTLFPMESNFWVLWNKRKGEYLQAQQLDRIECYSANDAYFHTIADFKSAFGKVAIDSLACLAPCDENSDAYHAMLVAHKHFSIGRQMYDDVVDLKEDLINKQCNYAVYKLRMACQREGIDIDSLNEVYLEKYLYVLGVSESILKEAILNFEIAKEVSKPFVKESSIWIEINNAHIGLTRNVLLKQSSYLKQIRSKAEQSNRKYSRRTGLNEHELERRISHGLSYLRKKLSDEGFWEEYLNSAGASNIWATSFIYAFIHDVESFGNFMSAEKIKSFLLPKLSIGFGYNDMTPTDGDSINFGMLALHAMGIDLRDSMSSLWRYQNRDGGFTTYCADDRDSLRDLMNFPEVTKFDAWEESHNCVSAVSFFLMSHLRKATEVEDKYQLLKSFLLNRSSHGMWDSYWWTSPLYATSFIIKAITESKDKDLLDVSDAAIHATLKGKIQVGALEMPFKKKVRFIQVWLPMR